MTEPMDPSTRNRTVLRGATLVSAPFTLGGVVCAAMCALSVAWVFGTDGSNDQSGWITAGVFGFLAVTLLVAARGCRVVIEGGRVTDQVAWRTVWSAHLEEIVEVRVRSGPWRTFEIEQAGGRRRVVLGTGPVQFPAYLLPEASGRDLATIDTLAGRVRS